MMELSKHVYDQLRTSSNNKEENICFSPLSIYMLFLLLYFGAKEKTKEVIQSMFDIAQQLTTLLHIENNESVILSNSVWADPSGFSDEFREKALQLRAYVASLDFGCGDASHIINTWVSAATKGLIKTIVPPGALSESTKMVLVNALYFRGLWETPFKPDNTVMAKFTLSNGEVVRTSTMSGAVYARTAITQKAGFVELPFEGHRDFSMILVIPTKGITLNDVEREFDSGDWVTLFGALKGEKINIHLPKFRIESTINLITVLLDLGMEHVFDTSADFTGISPGRPGDLYVSSLIHKAVIEVDEKGAIGAAATAAVVTRGLSMDRPVFVDRPFMYIVQQSGVPLFFGRVMDPRQ